MYLTCCDYTPQWVCMRAPARPAGDICSLAPDSGENTGEPQVTETQSHKLSVTTLVIGERGCLVCLKLDEEFPLILKVALFICILWACVYTVSRVLKGHCS